MMQMKTLNLSCLEAALLYGGMSLSVDLRYKVGSEIPGIEWITSDLQSRLIAFIESFPETERIGPRRVKEGE